MYNGVVTNDNANRKLNFVGVVYEVNGCMGENCDRTKDCGRYGLKAAEGEELMKPDIKWNKRKKGICKAFIKKNYLA